MTRETVVRQDRAYVTIELNAVIGADACMACEEQPGKKHQPMKWFRVHDTSQDEIPRRKIQVQGATTDDVGPLKNAGYDLNMGKSKPTLSSALIAVALHTSAFFLIPALLVLLTEFPEVFAFPTGFLLVWFTVRWANRQDDPRYARLPLDDP
jgi:hypothetical protein